MAESPNSSMTNEQKNAAASFAKMRPHGARIQAGEIVVFDEADVDFDQRRICRNAGS
jgi:hypothetical protein